MDVFSLVKRQSTERSPVDGLVIKDAALLLLVGIAFVVATGLTFPSLKEGSPCLWDMYNDQVTYLTAAQNLVLEGNLQSNVVYPSLLRQEHPFAFLYMPGTPAVFAAAYVLLGDGIITVVTPGVLAYLLGSLAVWYAATRTGGRLAGIAAGLLYLSFPVHVAFLHTAMTEPLLGAACALVLALGCAGSRSGAYWLAAAMALLAVLLRETALAYFVILAGLLVARSGGMANFRRLAAPVSGLSVGMGLVLYWASGRPSLFTANLLSDHFSTIYLDAYAFDGITTNASALMTAMGERVLRNIAMFFSSPLLNPEERVVLSMILLAVGFCLVRGAWRRDMFCIAVGLTGVFAIGLLMGTYKIEFFKGSRFLSFLWPACCVALAVIAPRLRSFGAVVLATVLVICLITSQTFSVKRVAVCTRWFDEAHGQERFLEQNAIGEAQVIAAQEFFGMSWALRTPGTRWAFFPSNIATFQLLRQKAGVDLIVLAPGPSQLPIVEVLRLEGYKVVATHDANGRKFLLLKTAEKPDTG